MTEELPRVLVVDDEPEILALTRRLFRHRLQMEVALSAQEALPLLERERFDVALVDFSMPVMNGVELVRRARALRPELHCMLVTAHVDLPEVRDALSSGLVEAVIGKPWRSEELYARVLRCVGRV